MAAPQITLIPLAADRRDTFIQELQNAFAVAIVEEYGPQEGEIVPHADIEQSLDQPGAEALQILLDGAAVGGAVVSGAQTGRRSLDLLYLRQNRHSRGDRSGRLAGHRGPIPRHRGMGNHYTVF